jgi:hypothetical protein
MSDDEPNQQRSGDPEEADQEPASETDQPAEQTEEQPAENGQPAEQSEEQPAEETGQQEEQAEEQPSAESDQLAEQSDAATEGGGVGGPADDAVAAGKGSTRPLQVTAEFTQEGDQVFGGEIRISGSEYDEKGVSRQIPNGEGVWQQTGVKGNKTTTPVLRVSTAKVAIWGEVRISTISSVGPAPGDEYIAQLISSERLVFAVPSGSTLYTLQIKFDVEVKPLPLNIPIDAPDAKTAKEKFDHSFLKGRTVVGELKIEELIPKQRFRFIGKYFTGKIFLAKANVQPVGSIDL